jgi:hypothetical protein
MKLKHKIGRPGYNSSPNLQKAEYRTNINPSTNKFTRNGSNLADFQYDVDAYEADRNQQISTMTPEQLRNLQYNDTTFTEPTQWNANKVITGGSYYYPGTKKVRAVDQPTYIQGTISRDANYSVSNPVDPSLNRAPGESTAVVNIPEILNFEPGKQKTLVRPVQKAYTQLEVAQDNEGKRLSMPRYNQQMKDYEAQIAAQQQFDEEKAQALGIVNN